MGFGLMMHGACGDRIHYALHARKIHRVLPDQRGGRTLAPADAGRCHHLDFAAQQGRQPGEQVARPTQLAGDAFAHPYRHRGRRLDGAVRILAHDIEMMVESGDLIDLRH